MCVCVCACVLGRGGALLSLIGRFTNLSNANIKVSSWLQSPSVILEPKKIKSDTISTVSPSISHEVMGPDAMQLPAELHDSCLDTCLIIAS